MKKLQLIFVSLFLAISVSSSAQVGIGTNTPNVSAALDITSTTSGFLPPRMTEAERILIDAPVAGLIIWCSNCGTKGELQVYNGTEWTHISGVPAETVMTVSDAPTIGVATAQNEEATIIFTAPTDNGGSTITTYTATSSPEGFTGTVSGSGSGSITVTGLTNDIEYTFTITATNGIGTSAASAASNSVTPSPVVGDYYQGGVVFYILESEDDGYIAGETHGLICAVEDQSLGIPWVYNAMYLYIAPTGNAIGSGSANTTAIINAYSSSGVFAQGYAAGLARLYRGGDFVDWFLPSLSELKEMYMKKETINTTSLENGGSSFSTSWYWSSSQESSKYAQRVDLGNGDSYTRIKTSSLFVRAVRAF